MKYAITGYGKMGREIEQVLIEKNIPYCIIDNNYTQKLEDTDLSDVETAIDFTAPSSFEQNLNIYIKHKINCVAGTTGWYHKMEDIKNLVNKSDIGFIWSGNFSLGVQILFQLIRYTGNIMNSIEAYDVFANEIHHREKADSPSGTMKMIGNILLEQLDRKDILVTQCLDRPVKSNEIHISSTRGGFVIGQHEITFDSQFDCISLKHSAKNRRGFAEGAIKACEFIKNKKGFFDIEDLIKDMIKSKN